MSVIRWLVVQEVCGRFEFARHFESHLARPPPFYMRMRTTISVEHSIDEHSIDGLGWKRLCTAFGPHSADLCNSLASTAKRLCTEYVDPKGIEDSLG